MWDDTSGYDGFLRKTDSLGNQLWCRRYGGATDVFVTGGGWANSGAYYLVGIGADSTGESYAMAKKTDSLGIPLWTRLVPLAVEANTCVVTSNGGVAFAGMGMDTTSPFRTIFLACLDGQGNQLLRRDYEQVWHQASQTWGIDATPDGGFVIVGDTQLYDVDPFWYATVLRVTATGDTVWQRRYHAGWPSANAFSVRALANGDLIVGLSVLDTTIWCAHPAVMRLDSDGNVIWVTVLPYTSASAVSATAAALVYIQPEGGYLISTGDYRWGLEGGVLLRMADNGDTLWSFRYEVSTPRSGGSDAGLDLSGGYYWGLGETYRFSESDHFRLVRLGPDNLSACQNAPVPSEIILRQNYPNPFNPTTVFDFSLPRTGQAKLTVYDVTGREVSVVSDGVLNGGEHRVTFDGSSLASGVYFARLQAGTAVQTRKMVLIR